jgi:hypothetical protein
MAESIVFNNATYIIPDVGESNWGQNLTNYFVAIPQGCYQLSGGTAPLTADLSFGTNFGLFAKYLTSVTANPASVGVLRLANTDAIEWRNAANNANLPLAVDSSNNLLWNGDIIATSGSSPVLSIAGTANEITASSATGNVTLSVPSTFIAPGSIAATTTLAGTKVTLSNTTNQIVLGTTNTVTISSTAPASSRVYTVPDAGGAANVVLDAGNYTIAGTWSFSNSITLASSKAVILTDNSTNTVTLKATNSTTSWTLSLPTTHGTNGFFLQTDGSGNTTWAPGGSGTISSGTSGHLPFYTAGTTLGDANGQTITGGYTFSGGAGAITMSASTIAMGANKITGLANGTVSTDAAAFGQVLPISGGTLTGALRVTSISSSSTGTLADGVNVSAVTVLTYGTASNLTVNSFAGGATGQMIFIANETLNTITFVHAANNIICPASTNLVIGARAGAIFIFDGSNWYCVGHS